MFTETFSTASHWLFAGAAQPPVSRTAVSRTPAQIAQMWTIGGPQGMSVDAAKKALGIRPGPEDLVVYSQNKPDGSSYFAAQLISCQPYRH